jgi:hypothetical protein
MYLMDNIADIAVINDGYEDNMLGYAGIYQ